jgi:hypothetical protein
MRRFAALQVYFETRLGPLTRQGTETVQSAAHVLVHMLLHVKGSDIESHGSPCPSATFRDESSRRETPQVTTLVASPHVATRMAR